MKQKHIVLFVLSAFYLLLFLPFLGQVHLFDWDEINFAEAAREMLVSGDWLNVQINFEPFWEKPPLFIWLQACSMSVFGVNEYAARLPNVLAGLATIIIIYRVSYAYFGQQASIAAVLLYMGSITPHFYFKSGIIDPLFNLFIFLSIYQLIRHIKWKGRFHFFWSGLFLGLAVMAKGPAAIAIVGLSGLVYQIIFSDTFYKVKHLLSLLVGLLLIPGIWFGVQIANNGWWFIDEFIRYQIELLSQPVASHGQPFYYHAVVLLIGCFPVLLIAAPSLKVRLKFDKPNTLQAWMKVTFWVVLILFSLVTTKIVHYSSMCYIPLAILGGEWVSRSFYLKKYQKLLLAVVGLFWVSALSFLVHFGNSASFRLDVNKYIADSFTAAQFAEHVQWSPLMYALPLASLVLTGFLIWKYNKANLMSYLIFHSFFISILMTQLVPKIEAYTQKSWVDHLTSYAGTETVHFTQGFKSYAHIYYTGFVPSQEFIAVKERVLNKLGFDDYFEMSREDKQLFDIALRSEVIEQTAIPFSLSAKINAKEELSKHPFLKLVFEGNGYSVWERK